jgi:hypothetical protein
VGETSENVCVGYIVDPSDNAGVKDEDSGSHKRHLLTNNVLDRTDVSDCEVYQV